LFDGLPGPSPRFLPVDFTAPEDGFPPPDYGIERFWLALLETGPRAFEALHLARADVENDVIRARARPLIYGYGAAAAGAGAVPIPLVGLGGLTGVLAVTLRVLAIRYGVAWSPGAFAQFSGAVGGGTLAWWTLSYGLRETLKIIPMFGGLAAGTLNAAAAFGVTVGIGEAACVWLGYRRRGLMAPDKEVRLAFSEGLASGLRYARSQAINAGKTTNEIR
jgi:uncharacterized protein (DUF697 family)